jgi:hypothetical protein
MVSVIGEAMGWKCLKLEEAAEEIGMVDRNVYWRSLAEQWWR